MLLWITDNKIVSGIVAARKTDGCCLIQTQGKHSLDAVGELLPCDSTIQSKLPASQIKVTVISNTRRLRDDLTIVSS